MSKKIDWISDILKKYPRGHESYSDVRALAKEAQELRFRLFQIFDDIEEIFEDDEDHITKENLYERERPCSHDNIEHEKHNDWICKDCDNFVFCTCDELSETHECDVHGFKRPPMCFDCGHIEEKHVDGQCVGVPHCGCDCKEFTKKNILSNV